jgi:glutaredoxin
MKNTTPALTECGVTLYSTSWCSHSRRARAFLDERSIPYKSVDIEADADAARAVETLNRGNRSVPTLVIHLLITEPRDEELELLLRRSGARLLEGIVYMATWCSDCQRTLAWLKKNGLALKTVDIDQDEAAALQVQAWNRGFRSVPTLDLTLCLTEPASAQLQDALGLLA